MEAAMDARAFERNNDDAFGMLVSLSQLAQHDLVYVATPYSHYPKKAASSKGTLMDFLTPMPFFTRHIKKFGPVAFPVPARISKSRSSKSHWMK